MVLIAMVFFFRIIQHFYALFILLIFDTPIISTAYLCTPFSSVLSDLIFIQLEIYFQYIYFFMEPTNIFVSATTKFVFG